MRIVEPHGQSPWPDGGVAGIRVLEKALEPVE